MSSISIIIPHYKDKERLLKLLLQLEEQTLERNSWEVLVVNNDPNIPLILPNKFLVSYKLIILNEYKSGSYAARNRGIIAANGEILAFTDSDCLPDKNWLLNAFNFFKNDKEKEIGILTGPIPLFFKNPQCLSAAEVYEKYTGFTTKSYANDGNAVTANWFSYATVIAEFGGFDSNLKSNGDTVLSRKISSKYKVIYQSNIIVLHPARYEVRELTAKYKRLLGGIYTRKYKKKPIKFLKHLITFILRRYRFAIKKFITVSWKESKAIFKVCHSINKSAISEYFKLINGGSTAR